MNTYVDENVTRERLKAACRKVMFQSGTVKVGEKVVLLTDNETSPWIAYYMMEAANDAGAEPVILTMNKAVPGGGYLPDAVCEALKTADLILSPTATSVYHSFAIKVACNPPYHARYISLSEITEDAMVNGGMTCDFDKIRPDIYKVTDIWTKGSDFEFSTPAGTHFTASIKGRTALNDDGIVEKPGDFIGLPVSEVFLAPIEASVNGTVVVDVMASGGVGIIKNPITITIVNGKAVKIEGKEEAEKLREILKEANHPNAYQVAELAVGMNPCCRVTGCVNEDEGIAGTGHIALGNSQFFGGLSDAPCHVDLVQDKPTIKIDGQLIFKDGVQMV